MVHVSMRNKESNFACANGSGCTRFRVKVSKKRTTSSLCPHEHIVIVASGKNLQNALDQSPEVSQTDPTFDNHVWLQNTSKFLFRNRRMDLADVNIRNLERKVMTRNKTDDWPRVYQVQA